MCLSESMCGQGICTTSAFIDVLVSYPSPTHSVCEDIVVTLLVIPSTCIRERDIVIASVSYPEHVYTWEGYSSHSVSSCVCLCVST